MDTNTERERQHRILLIEDNLDNIELASEILRQEGYFVGVAKNGLEALKYVEENELPDLFLLDIAMPEMDGFQTCSKLKDNERTVDIPIIFLSALNDADNIIKGFELGAVDYVFKPFNFYELLSRVKTHIELKDSRAKLKSINADLEKVVEERTQELRNAYDRLENLDRAKTEFLSLISHELRTPLNGIIGFFSILNESNESAPIIDKNFKSSVDDLIQKLLRFSELSILFTELRASYYDTKFKRIEVNEIVENAIEKHEAKIDRKNLNILKLYGENPHIETDELLINNCMEIVLDNAIKFSPENGDIELDIEESAHFTSIIVSDQGPGFSDKARNYLFELFETDNFSNTYSGFGLGMATVKLIMDFLDGKIEAENKNGRGAIIRISFKKN